MTQNERFFLRSATPDDVDFIFKLRVETMKGYYEATCGWRRDEQMSMAGDELENAQIITVAEQPVGVIKVIPREHDLHIHQVQLLPKLQGKGIGGQLICQVIGRARENELPVTLSVLKGNPALRLYERLGFLVTEEGEHFYRMSWQDN